ncbi:MAG: oligosaccharide flippase family protein [Muribaculaceae bacterium]|nr:oligosaccharide flippase family protein [Muribaculaceae bacterium]
MAEEREITVNEQSPNEYRSILKRISAFGGVQIFSILINLVRGKFVALFLGPEGMGLSSMLTSSTNTIQQFAGLGLNLSLVKEVAAQKEKGDVSGVLNVALRLIYFTAILGCVVTLVLSPWLSKWSFGSYDYTLGFAILSAGVGLSVAGAGYLSLLQGLGEVRRLAWASVVGGLAGLLIGVPLYYFFGLAGIVPALLVYSVSLFLFYYFSLRKSTTYERQRFVWKESKPLVRKMISLGVVLMIGSLVGTLTNYILNVFVRSVGSLQDVGLFQAANSLTAQYSGIVFSALALDYFPRLSAVASDADKMRAVVNRQMEIVVLIVTPIIIGLMLTAPLLIELLLSEEFMSVAPLMRWLGLGVLLQSVTFPMGYLFVAKDNKKIYVWMEVVLANVMWIICSVIFYFLYGLIGLGISLVVRTFIDIFVSYFVCRHYYDYRISGRVLKIVAISLAFGAAGFVISLMPGKVLYFCLGILLMISAAFSFTILRRGVKA